MHGSSKLRKGKVTNMGLNRSNFSRWNRPFILKISLKTTTKYESLVSDTNSLPHLTLVHYSEEKWQLIKHQIHTETVHTAVDRKNGIPTPTSDSRKSRIFHIFRTRYFEYDFPQKEVTRKGTRYFRCVSQYCVFVSACTRFNSPWRQTIDVERVHRYPNQTSLPVRIIKLVSDLYVVKTDEQSSRWMRHHRRVHEASLENSPLPYPLIHFSTSSSRKGSFENVEKQNHGDLTLSNWERRPLAYAQSSLKIFYRE